eukprot:TRINITY_DN15514_c0_g2_i1.p1 TRINITY_DN15514_c0_g2~~TRINITY_DN15514_c0_g2_i1.p1  ORF type:complete len:164 (+),score=21.93 TRINITY_DN15514_c0_g2_i1:38-529(+)
MAPELYFFVTEVMCNGVQASELSRNAIEAALANQLRKLHGLYGASVEMRVMQFAPPLALIRCDRKHHMMVRNSLTLLTSVEKVNCFFRTRHASASLSSCQNLLPASSQDNRETHTRDTSHAAAPPAKRPRFWKNSEHEGAPSGAARPPAKKSGGWWQCFEGEP